MKMWRKPAEPVVAQRFGLDCLLVRVNKSFDGLRFDCLKVCLAEAGTGFYSTSKEPLPFSFTLRLPAIISLPLTRAFSSK